MTVQRSGSVAPLPLVKDCSKSTPVSSDFTCLDGRRILPNRLRMHSATVAAAVHEFSVFACFSLSPILATKTWQLGSPADVVAGRQLSRARHLKPHAQ